MKHITFFFLAGILSATAQTQLPLWHEDMPGIGAELPELADLKKEAGVLRVTNVSEPTLTLYPAKNEGSAIPFVIVCPGGGYNILAFDKEGTEIAEWLNSIGISAAVLKYRCPNNRSGALEDARQAVRTVRENAAVWNVAPHCIGMIGFSAGGHLTAACSNSPDRPDFSILIYPAYLYKTGGIELADDIHIDVDTPPAFIAQARDDLKYYRSTLAYAAALDAYEIPAEIHLFAKGRHGYGLRPSNHPVSNWPSLCEAWMRETGLLVK